jgi:hypothetical protein
MFDILTLWQTNSASLSTYDSVNISHACSIVFTLISADLPEAVRSVIRILLTRRMHRVAVISSVVIYMDRLLRIQCLQFLAD